MCFSLTKTSKSPTNLISTSSYNQLTQPASQSFSSSLLHPLNLFSTPSNPNDHSRENATTAARAPQHVQNIHTTTVS